MHVGTRKDLVRESCIEKRSPEGKKSRKKSITSAYNFEKKGRRCIADKQEQVNTGAWSQLRKWRCRSMVFTCQERKPERKEKKRKERERERERDTPRCRKKK
jgi:hypothetical protein